MITQKFKSSENNVKTKTIVILVATVLIIFAQKCNSGWKNSIYRPDVDRVLFYFSPRYIESSQCKNDKRYWIRNCDRLYWLPITQRSSCKARPFAIQGTSWKHVNSGKNAAAMMMRRTERTDRHLCVTILRRSFRLAALTIFISISVYGMN